jgi:hypothetical protein
MDRSRNVLAPGLHLFYDLVIGPSMEEKTYNILFRLIEKLGPGFLIAVSS